MHVPPRAALARGLLTLLLGVAVSTVGYVTCREVEVTVSAAGFDAAPGTQRTATLTVGSDAGRDTIEVTQASDVPN